MRKPSSVHRIPPQSEGVHTEEILCSIKVEKRPQNDTLRGISANAKNKKP